ncbi:MAG: 3-aminobutyryl-CoA ammonia lyase [Deltaproteobacteria bacterium]|nr:3-aminobutyryl-CoA ammonia lyase [Deltaproteobacteria bacterium]
MSFSIVTHRIRLNQADAHYGGNLVDGARILQLFGDVATELCILSDRDEGLLRAYETLEFLAPVYAGDFIEVKGEMIQKGKRSRRMKLEAYKVIEASRDPMHPNAAKPLDPPLLVVKAEAVCVVP